MWNRYDGEKQMTTTAKPLIGASSMVANWDAINWQAIEQQVKRLQMRIAKATREGRWGKVNSLQWLLTHAYSAKLLAVRRVTRNSGRKTPGVDGIVWKTAAQKINATRSLQRRIYILKKNGKLRPLGIPTMFDRSQQALHLLGLESVAETLADPNAYGFRPKRSTADAIGQCFTVLCRKRSAQWILEGDIKACFDRISHPTDQAFRCGGGIRFDQFSDVVQEAFQCWLGGLDQQLALVGVNPTFVSPGIK